MLNEYFESRVKDAEIYSLSLFSEEKKIIKCLNEGIADVPCGRKGAGTKSLHRGRSKKI